MRYRSVRASRGERWRSLPGDDLIPAAQGMLTHAITIRRPRSEVWPWLVQMGAGRAGWYSYDFVDNGWQHSAERLVPKLQHIAVGDVFPALPQLTEGFVVLQYQPERYLVLGWPSPAGPPITTWAFVLEEPEPGCTRLIVRSRADTGYRPPFGLPKWTVKTLVPLGHAVMQRKQLLGIARRAEAWAHSLTPPGRPSPLPQPSPRWH
jgi:hypothetical protein